MLKAVKGTRDLLPPETELFQRVEAAAREMFRLYGFAEIRTPVLEATELFARAVGVETDLVGKEMFTFRDRDDASLSLRPEATAGVVRAYVEHRLWERPGPTRLYYAGPMFRRERPQKGRYRQFSQIGAEVFGDDSAQADYELLEMLSLLLARCGVSDAELLLNSLGCAQDRPAYLAALRAALAPVAAGLCDDCRRRAETNPLRVLDCKVPADQPVIAGLPKIVDFLDDACRAHFSDLKEMLDAGGISYRLEPRLVRGLDYYNRTAFEFVHGALGGQNSLLGGGRYDGLAQALGAPASAPSAAIGFAIGEDRLIVVMEEVTKARAAADQESASAPIHLLPLSLEARPAALRLARDLRAAGLAVVVGAAGRKLGKQLELAARAGARRAVILGPDELAAGRATVKDLAAGSQKTLPLATLAKELKADPASARGEAAGAAGPREAARP